MAALDIRDAVVTRQPLVEKGVFRSEQLDRTSILANDTAEEQLGLTLERDTQGIVESSDIRVAGPDVLEISEQQPLGSEVLRQHLGSRIREHSLDLTPQHQRIPELSLECSIQQLVIWNAAPQEERQTRRHLHIIQLIRRRLVSRRTWNNFRRSVRRGGRIGFNAEQEQRIDEQPAQGELDSNIEAAPGRTRPFVEANEHSHVLRSGSSTIAALRQARQDALRAGCFFRGGGGITD